MSRYKRYEGYKDSGVEWIGEIPEHWGIIKLKFLSTIFKGKNPQELTDEWREEFLPYLSMEYLRNSGDTLTLYAYPEKNLVTVNNSDILILWDGSNAGEIVEGKNGILSSTMAKIVPNNIVTRYLYWFLKGIEKFFKDNTVGMGIPHVNGETLKNHLVLLPNLQDQNSIANFLDQKTAEIDGLIADKEKLIELLQEKRQAIITEAVTKGLNPNARMKDSGSEWISEIPQHWNLRRIKYLANVRNVKAVDSDNDKTYIGLENIESRTGKLLLNRNDEQQLIGETANIFKKGDVLFGKLRPYLAKCIIADFDGRCTSELLVLRTTSYILPEYLCFLMLSPKFIDVVNSSTYGAKMPRASWDFIGNLQIPLPSIKEQEEIVEYLTEFMSRIDDLISDINTQIQKLKEYRQSLISEAVTGKIDVRVFENKDEVIYSEQDSSPCRELTHVAE
jgi:type I restriction enzyme S subunit